MSTVELRALRCVGEGRPDDVEEAHKELLVRMGLARGSGSGQLEITEDGTRRLASLAY